MNHLATDKFFYYGMLNKNYANGLGRATGKWGMYEGNFKNGKPSGYGRLIVNSTKYWYGFFDGIMKKPYKKVQTFSWTTRSQQYYCEWGNPK